MPLPPSLPLHMAHHPVMMGGGQHPVPGMAMNALWYAPPYGTLALPPPYPLFQHPHPPGFNAASFLPWGFTHHPVAAPAAPVLDVVATQGCGNTQEGAEMGHTEGIAAAALTTAVQPKKRYLNQEISEGGKYTYLDPRVLTLK